MATAQIDGRELARALRRIARVNKGQQADGTFTLRAGELQIDWGNGGEVLDVDCADTAQCHLADRYVRKLPRVLRGARQMTLEIREGRLFLDRFSIDAFVERNPQAPLLPPSPRHVDFLLLAQRHEADVIDEAGLRAEVDVAKERLEVSLKAAARKLRWLQLEEGTIRAFLEAHLAKMAEAPASLPLNDANTGAADGDQFSLFD